MKWLDDFKRALIEQDFVSIEKLIDDFPHFDEIEHQKLALSLIQEAKEVVKHKKDETFKEMQKIQKAKKFENRKEEIHSLDMSY